MATLFLSRLNSSFEVANIVQRVEDTDNVDTVRDRFLYEILNAVVSIVAVAEHILTAEEHLKLSIRHFASDNSQALPWVFVKEADTSVESSAAPNFCRVIADLVHFRHYREHFVERHSGSYKRLMSVTQDGFCDFKLSHLYQSFQAK